MIWSLIVGAIIGVIAGAITNKGKSMGWKIGRAHV